jgi:hypothetical protein
MIPFSDDEIAPAYQLNKRAPRTVKKRKEKGTLS